MCIRHSSSMPSVILACKEAHKGDQIDHIQIITEVAPSMALTMGGPGPINICAFSETSGNQRQICLDPPELIKS